MAGAALFSWLQGAEFYRGFHARGVDLLGEGTGRNWLDVGCGPGLLTRLAAERGYAARGIDRDPEMISAALRMAEKTVASCTYAIADIEAEQARGTRYDVVSASSLLVVLPDPARALAQLISLTKPGGRLLIIEAAPTMAPLRALSALASGQLGKRGYMLMPWALARAGKTLPAAVLYALPGRVERHSFLSGLVDGWLAELAP